MIQWYPGFFFWAIFRTSLLVQITFPSSAYVQTVNNNVCNSYFSAIWIEVEYIRKKSDLITSHLNTVWYLDPFPEFFFLKYPSKRSDLNNYYQTFSEKFVKIYLSTPSTSRVLDWCLGKKSTSLAYHTSARWVLSLGTIRHNLRVIFSSAALINKYDNSPSWKSTKWCFWKKLFRMKYNISPELSLEHTRSITESIPSCVKGAVESKEARTGD